MIGLTYNRLLSLALSTPPYRGTEDRYPLEARRQNWKYFVKRQENGENVFDVCKGWEYNSTEMTKEEHAKQKAAGVRDLYEYPRGAHGYQTADIAYGRHEQVYNVIGTVRRDNTFEFVKDSYHQGEHQFLSTYTNGWFYNDSRRGGMVYSDTDIFNPIWRGMRVDCDTCKPTTPYEVSILHIDRKKTKGLLTKYGRFYKVAETMLKALDTAMFITTTTEVVDGIFGEGEHKQYRPNADYLEHAEKIVDNAPLDAFILYALGYGVGRLEYIMRYQSHTNNLVVTDLFTNVKRKMSKEIYKSHREVFKRVVCEPNERYPVSDWGITVTVNGVQVEQCS